MGMCFLYEKGSRDNSKRRIYFPSSSFPYLPVSAELPTQVLTRLFIPYHQKTSFSHCGSYNFTYFPIIPCIQPEIFPQTGQENLNINQ